MDEKNKPTPKGLNTPKQNVPADKLVFEFLKKTNIELYQAPFKVKDVSDGSIIVEKPVIKARYLK